MNHRRRAAAIGAVIAGLAGLAACAKPTPNTTVTAGSDTVSSEAVCYRENGRLSDSELRSCLGKKPTETLEVTPGEQVRFGVDPTVAEHGWFLAINGRPAMDPVHQTYRSFNGESFFSDAQGGRRADEARVTLIEAAGQEGGSRGVWTFTLKLTG